MTRRSRTRGASGSGKAKRPSSAPPAEQHEFEAQLDEVSDALFSEDRERLEQALEALTVVPSFAPDVITRRMIEGRERAPGIMLAILGDITQERMPHYLQRIIKARNAPDQVRYEAQRVLGWDPFREQKHRVGFLRSLRDPYGVLATSTNAAAVAWPSRIEALSEVADHLSALQPPARYEALDRIVAQAGWNVIPLLHGLLNGEDPPVQLRALDGLAALQFSGSIGPLRRLVALTANDDVRRRAEDVLRDVTFDRDSAPDTVEEPFPQHGLAPFVWARLSRVEPDGAQSLWVTRKIGEDLFQGTNFAIGGPLGLDDIFQLDEMPMEFLEEELLAIEGDIAPLTPIDLSVARGFVAMAVERAAAAGQQAGFEFELFEPMFHDDYPPSAGETIDVPTLDDAGYVEKTNLRERGAELLEHPLFTDWALGFEHVVAVIGSNLLQSQDDEDDEASRELTFKLLDVEARQGVRDALCRQAWLLDARGDTVERDIALALAAWLPAASDQELTANAFIAGLVQTSLAVTTSLLDISRWQGDLEGLDEDWLDDEDLDDDWDDGLIEADWTAANETDEPPREH